MKKPYFHADDFSPCNSPGALVRRIYTHVLRRADATLDLGDLTFTQWIVLVQLRAGLADTGAELCRNLGHDSGAATRLLDQLESRGYVERHRSKEDRRVSKLTLTPQGCAVAAKLTPQVVDFWNELLGDFTHAEISTLMALLGRLLARLERDNGYSKPAAEKNKVV